jgi:serine/threonine protein phosphatase PrpC
LAKLAGETVKAKYLGSATNDIPSALREALTVANRRIFSEAQSNPDLRGMGTTTSALAVRENQGWFAHVGDSRIYLIRGSEIRQLTDDHSLVATMMREGLLTAKEAENHPRRNVLQRSIGVGEDVEIDVKGPFDLQEGDMFILCSDGLHGLVKEDELKEVAQLGVEEAADEFVKRALDRGAPDNVTVIVARVERSTGEDTLPGETLDGRTLDLGAFDETISDDTVREVPTPTLPGAIPLAATAEVYMPPSSSAALPITAEVPLPPAKDESKVSTDKIAAIKDRTDKVPALAVTAEVPLTPEPAPRPAAKASADVDATIRVAPVTIPGSVPRRPAEKPRKKSGRNLVKWTLIFVVVLAAAGAWLFWSQQQGFADSSSTTSQR